MTRIIAANASESDAISLQKHLLTAFKDILEDVNERERIGATQVVRAVLSGNTAMVSLLTQMNLDRLLIPQYWMKQIECIPENIDFLSKSLGIHPRAKVDVLPPIAGFVGSDILAGIWGLGIGVDETPSLLIDFGTNSELAFWDGKDLCVTSASGGPAFEGSGIQCGMSYGPGAVNRVTVDSRRKMQLEVVSGAKACGICGSGLIDIIAHLLELGIVDERGRFADESWEQKYILSKEHSNIFITKRDIDLFQRAKAAIGGGIQKLCDRVSMPVSEIKRIYLAGAFGNFIDLENAMRIGLLPDLDPEVYIAAGNSSLTGCEDMLFMPVAMDEVRSLAQAANIVDLSTEADFDQLFLDNLFLGPMGGNKDCE